jgi:hypothetical protein
MVRRLIVVLSLTAVVGSGCSNGESAGAPTARAAPAISGSFDDWRAAICKPGTYFDANSGGAHFFANAIGHAVCQTNSRTEIMIGKWSDNFEMNNDLALWHSARAYYTSCNQSGGIILAFVTAGSDAAALQPLQQFGFTVQPV